MESKDLGGVSCPKKEDAPIFGTKYGYSLITTATVAVGVGCHRTGILFKA